MMRAPSACRSGPAGCDSLGIASLYAPQSRDEIERPTLGSGASKSQSGGSLGAYQITGLDSRSTSTDGKSLGQYADTSNTVNDGLGIQHLSPPPPYSFCRVKPVVQSLSPYFTNAEGRAPFPFFSGALHSSCSFVVPLFLTAVVTLTQPSSVTMYRAGRQCIRVREGTTCPAHGGSEACVTQRGATVR